MKKLKKEYLSATEFFDVYGISLLANKPVIDRNWLLVLLIPIAQKYVRISNQAIQSELKEHFLDGGYNDQGQYEMAKKTIFKNRRLLKKLKLKNEWKSKTLLTDITIKLFRFGHWADMYGGYHWVNIAEAVKQLELYLEKNNLNKILVAIDRLNDLEHNTSKYLSEYFSDYKTLSASQNFFEYVCDFKSFCSNDELIEKCSKEIKKLWKEAMHYE